MTFLIIILIIFCIWLIFGPYIRQWLIRRAQRKFTDHLRRQMGMPTEEEMRKASRQSDARNKRSGRKGFWSRPDRSGRPDPFSMSADEPVIPKDYAVDVEYTEIREFSQTSIAADAPESEPRGRKTHTESQISDVEYVEIKD